MNPAQPTLKEAVDALNANNHQLARSLAQRLIGGPVDHFQLYRVLALSSLDNPAACFDNLAKAIVFSPGPGAQDTWLAYLNLAEVALATGNRRLAFQVCMAAIRVGCTMARFGEILKELTGKERPSILVNCLPGSGSIFIRNKLMEGLGLVNYNLGDTAFPHFTLDPYMVQRVSMGWVTTHSHFPATPINLHHLDLMVPKMVVHVRDPRPALLSQVHHLINNPKWIKVHYPRPPADYETRSLTEQIDWYLDNMIPLYAEWIEGWVDAASDPELSTEILFTRHDDLAEDPQAFFNSILDFFEIDRGEFRADLSRPVREKADHFRKGDNNEWREVFTAEQADRAARLIGERVLDRFGWPRD